MCGTAPPSRVAEPSLFLLDQTPHLHHHHDIPFGHAMSVRPVVLTDGARFLAFEQNTAQAEGRLLPLILFRCQLKEPKARNAGYDQRWKEATRSGNRKENRRWMNRTRRRPHRILSRGRDDHSEVDWIGLRD